MQLINGSKFLAVSAFGAHDKAGREHLVIVAKSSWRIPDQGQRARPIEPQPIVEADLYAGEPGMSALLYGSDILHRKPKCDVLLNANGHAPEGKPVAELLAGFRIGNLQKLIKVHGKRQWHKRLGVYALSAAEPFLSMPLHFGLAFGGMRPIRGSEKEGKPTLFESLLTNPAGIGWGGKQTEGDLDGAPAPSLEAMNDPVRSPGGDHAPVAFSAIGRHWQPRAGFAGTYDDAWLRDVFPFLPADFDDRFNQCAPVDQQIDYPVGGEEVVLLNMMKDQPQVRFVLPNLQTVPIAILDVRYKTHTPTVVVDTLYFEPDEHRFSAVWRASIPLKRGIHEIKTVSIGALARQQLDAEIAGGGCKNCGKTESGLETEA